jgi:hypothetical protein
MRETFPVLIGTLVSQTAINIFALVLLGGIIVSTTDLFQASTQKLFLVSTAPLLILLAVLLAPSLVKVNGEGRVARAIQTVRGAIKKARRGLTVFRDPRRGSFATFAQLFAWFLQLLACWALFAALGLDHKVAIGAAAACLFAVNVTAVVPATPSNIGIFQLAIISVLNKGFGIPAADALAYGAFPRWFGRASPGLTCASERCRPPRCTFRPSRAPAIAAPSASPSRPRPAGRRRIRKPPDRGRGIPAVRFRHRAERVPGPGGRSSEPRRAPRRTGAD